MGRGFHLNPYEQSTLQDLSAALSHPGTADLFSQYGAPLIGEAQQRRATNLQTREQGIQQLQQQAMQLAAAGGSEQAIMNATMGQASALPMMNGPQGQGMLGDLAGYVGGLDWQPTSAGPISGLAPADYRTQFQTTTPGAGLTPEDTAAIATQVQQGLEAGHPFIQIRESIRRMGISLGYDEATTNQAVTTAESAYQQMVGASLPEMRTAADQLRSVQAIDPSALANFFNQDTSQQAFGQVGAGLTGDTAANANVQALVGQLANTPGALNYLISQAGPLQAQTQHNYDQPSWTSYLPFQKNFLSGGLMGW